MDSERRLRAEVVSALDVVTPPAPWLASSIAASLTTRRSKGAREQRGATRVSGLRMSSALALGLVLLVVTAAGIFSLRATVPPVPAHPATRTVAEFRFMVDTDYSTLVLIGRRYPSTCALGDGVCSTSVSELLAARRKWIDDLDRSTPPSQFAALQPRLRAILLAGNSDLAQVLAAYDAGDGDWLAAALAAASSSQDALDRLFVYVISADAVTLNAADQHYSALVGADYDKLRLPTLVSGLLACAPTDAACAGYIRDLQAGLQAFSADLQATPVPARFDSRVPALRAELAAESVALDELAAAYAGGHARSLWAAKTNLSTHAGQIFRDSADILYPAQ